MTECVGKRTLGLDVIFYLGDMATCTDTARENEERGFATTKIYITYLAWPVSLSRRYSALSIVGVACKNPWGSSLKKCEGLSELTS